MRLELGKVSLGQVYQLCTDGSNAFFQYPQLKKAVFELVNTGHTTPVAITSNFLSRHKASNGCAALMYKIHCWFLALWHNFCLFFSRRYTESFKAAASLIDSKCAAVKLVPGHGVSESVMLLESSGNIEEQKQHSHEEKKAACSSVMEKCKKIFLGKLAAHQKFKHDIEARVHTLQEKQTELDLDIQITQSELSEKTQKLAEIDPEKDPLLILQTSETNKLKLQEKKDIMALIDDFKKKNSFMKLFANTADIVKGCPDFNSHNPDVSYEKIKQEVEVLDGLVKQAAKQASECKKDCDEKKMYLQGLQLKITALEKQKSDVQSNLNALVQIQLQIANWEKKALSPLTTEEKKEFNQKFLANGKKPLTASQEALNIESKLTSQQLQPGEIALPGLSDLLSIYPKFDAFIEECTKKMCAPLCLVMKTFIESCGGQPCVKSWGLNKGTYELVLNKPLYLWTAKPGYPAGAILMLDNKSSFKMHENKIEFLSGFSVFLRWGPANITPALKEISFDADKGEIKFTGSLGSVQKSDSESLAALVQSWKAGEIVVGNPEVFYQKKHKEALALSDG